MAIAIVRVGSEALLQQNKQPLPMKFTPSTFPLTVILGRQEFQIINRTDAKFNAPYLLIQPEIFTKSNETRGYIELKEGIRIPLGRELPNPGGFEYDTFPPTVSLRQCSIMREGKTFTIVDLGSTYGTFIDMSVKPERREIEELASLNAEFLLSNRAEWMGMDETDVFISRTDAMERQIAEKAGIVPLDEPNYTCLHLITDNKGNIVFIVGHLNEDKIPEKYKKGKDYGEYFGTLINVNKNDPRGKMFKCDNSSTYFWYGVWMVPQTIRVVMEATVEALNKISSNNPFFMSN